MSTNRKTETALSKQCHYVQLMLQDSEISSTCWTGFGLMPSSVASPATRTEWALQWADYTRDVV